MSKRFTRRTRKTADDEARIEIIKVIGCICCLINGNGWRYAEWDHFTVSGFTTSHQDTAGLCLWHHRAICEEGMTTSKMTAKYGPSKAKGSVTFHNFFGTKEFLLGYQNKLIEERRNGYEAE